MRTIDTEELLKRIEKMGDAIESYAKAKSERDYIKEYRKSLKALLQRQAPESDNTDKKREAYAYSHQEYLDLLAGYKAAVEIATKNEWALEQLKIEVEMWRTINANQRYQKDRV